MGKLPDQMICPGLYFLKEPRTEPDWSSLNVSTTRSSFPSLKWFLKSWLYCLEAKVLEARIPSKLQATVRDSFLALLKAFQNISLSSSGYKNTFWLEEETELPRLILVLKAVFNFYWTGLSMGKKHSVLLQARISIPCNHHFIYREEGSSSEQTETASNGGNMSTWDVRDTMLIHWFFRPGSWPSCFLALLSSDGSVLCFGLFQLCR